MLQSGCSSSEKQVSSTMFSTTGGPVTTAPMSRSASVYPKGSSQSTYSSTTVPTAPASESSTTGGPPVATPVSEGQRVQLATLSVEIDALTERMGRLAGYPVPLPVPLVSWDVVNKFVGDDAPLLGRVIEVVSAIRSATESHVKGGQGQPLVALEAFRFLVQFEMANCPAEDTGNPSDYFRKWIFSAMDGIQHRAGIPRWLQQIDGLYATFKRILTESELARVYRMYASLALVRATTAADDVSLRLIGIRMGQLATWMETPRDTPNFLKTVRALEYKIEALRMMTVLGTPVDPVAHFKDLTDPFVPIDGDDLL